MHWHRRAWAAEPQDFLCSNIAIAYAQAGNRKQAELWWRRTLAMGDAGAALELARLLLKTRRRHDIARAMALLQQATARRNRQRITIADREEAQELLLGLRKSRRGVLARS